MTDIRRLSPRVAVAPQVRPEDIAGIAASGFAGIINNRPDGEVPGQPAGSAIALAAEAAGLTYADIPIGPAGMGMEDVEDCAAILRDATGPVLLFCRSGTRSANLALLAAALMGDDTDALIEAAAAHGYELGHLRTAAGRLKP
jgi:uncharacterized protein (TIGR01244 family)